jgi:hypothetical protein
MAAPKGNQFWKLRSKHGRDKLFETPALLWEAACEYFEWCEANPLMEVEQAKTPAKAAKDDKGNLYFPPNIIELPKMRAFTIRGLCLYLNANEFFFNGFESDMKGKVDDLSIDFYQICTRIRDIIYQQKFVGAAAGFLNPNMICRDLGLSDRNVLAGDKDNPIETKFDITLNLNK